MRESSMSALRAMSEKVGYLKGMRRAAEIVEFVESCRMNGDPVLRQVAGMIRDEAIAYGEQ